MARLWVTMGTPQEVHDAIVAKATAEGREATITDRCEYCAHMKHCPSFREGFGCNAGFVSNNKLN